jgi:hypothetical protein
MSMQQHIDDLLDTRKKNGQDHHQEWLALLNQWEEDQKA